MSNEHLPESNQRNAEIGGSLNPSAKFGEPKAYAAGIPAILSTLKHVQQGPGLIKGLRVLGQMNQPNGVDCVSCAWPDPESRSMFEFCENGAKAVTDESTNARIEADFFRKHSIEELSKQSDYWLNAQGRLTEPMVRRPGASHYQPIDWDEAFSLIADRLKSLADPNQASFYTSGRTSNEAAYLYQLLVRKFGTNNLPDCSNMCHESTGVALLETVGIGKGTIKLEVLYEAQLILVVGQNPGTNHPRMLSALQKAKANGAIIVSINPLQEAGLQGFKNPQDFLNPLKAVQTLVGPAETVADRWLPVKLNGDVALFQALCKRLLELEQQNPNILDRKFIDNSCLGFASFKDQMERLTWDELLQGCALPFAQIQELADLIAIRPKMVLCWAMGITQHRNGVDNIRAMVNLCLMRGSIGKPGAGLCPVRGNSNVQGDRTVGITCRPKADFLDALETRYRFTAPREVGLDTVASIEAMERGQVKVFTAMGGNFLSACPDTARVAKAFAHCDLTVQISTKLNRSHLVTGQTALILPCLGRTELDQQTGQPQFVTVENSMGKVHRSQGRLAPASSKLLSEVAIVCRLAQKLWPQDSLSWQQWNQDYRTIRSEIEAVVGGFANYEQQVRGNGFYLPNGPRHGSFPTASGKAQFSVVPLPQWELNNGELLMMTIRSHDQFNTTIYGLDDRYRGVYQERQVVFLSPTQASQLGFSDGQVVNIHNRQGVQVDQFRIVTYPMADGCCATYFPECNPLIPLDSYADGSRTPTSKSVIVRLKRA
jgi:molybdopterin-dependent oxidoreductase alpha subunit